DFTEASGAASDHDPLLVQIDLIEVTGGNINRGRDNSPKPKPEDEEPAVEFEVIKETNESGETEIITKVTKDQVASILTELSDENDTIIIPLEDVSEGEIASAELPFDLFKEAAKKNNEAIVEISNKDGVYKLPISEINISELAKDLGVDGEEVNIVVSINAVHSESIEDIILKNNLNPVSDIIDFSVKAIAGEKSIDIDYFTQYVTREMISNNQLNKDEVVAVRINDDGTFSPVPTLIEGEKAVIKSLTNSKYMLVESDQSFSDVNGINWAEDYIEKLASKYIIKGKEDGTYAPKEDISRAQFTVLLVRALGLSSEEYDSRFIDVDGDEWFNAKGELMAAVKAGIIKGKEDGRFAPYEKLTREQASVMIQRAMKFVGYDENELDDTNKISDFKDVDNIGSWAIDSVEIVYQAGIVTGNETGTLDPSGYTKRDQMAKILLEFLLFVDLIN
ncbi:S-layer homology domain-containing protein, partial [Cytobacillus sp. IB215316]|uniref:S-layer homology domain-containing protein n=1 Tax=Cytobacillus sp. IB215316 TaxID=3097354 RepID=UPI002A1680A1